MWEESTIYLYVDLKIQYCVNFRNYFLIQSDGDTKDQRSHGNPSQYGRCQPERAEKLEQ